MLEDVYIDAVTNCFKQQYQNHIALFKAINETHYTPFAHLDWKVKEKCYTTSHG